MTSEWSQSLLASLACDEERGGNRRGTALRVPEKTTPVM